MKFIDNLLGKNNPYKDVLLRDLHQRYRELSSILTAEFGNYPEDWYRNKEVYDEYKRIGHEIANREWDIDL